MAGYNLGDILVNIKANTDGLKKGLDDVQNMGDQTKTLGDKIQKGMNIAAAGLAVVGAGLTVYAKGAVNYTEDLVKSSTALGRVIGTSTEEASRLSAALGRMGIDADKAQTVFGIFAKKISEANGMTDSAKIAQEGLSLQVRQTQKDIDDTTALIQKNGDKSGELSLKVETLKNKMAGLQDQLKQSSNAFAQLGVDTKNADGTQKDFTVILGEVADKFKAMPNGVDKTTLAMDLFGRSGKDMIKVLNLGSDGIADLEKKADSLGLTLNANTIGKINDLIQSQKDLKEQTDALKIAVGTATAPIMTSFNKTLNDMVSGLLNTKGPVHDVTVGVLAYGGPVASAASATLGFLANLDQAAPILLKMADALKITAVAQWALNIAMDANPLVLIALAVLALIAGLVLLYENVDSVRAIFDSAFKWILGVISDVWNWIQQNWPLVGALLAGPIGLAVAEIATHFGDIKQWANDAWQFIVGIWQGAGRFFRGIGSDIQSALGDAFGFLGSVFSGAWEGLKSGFKGALNFVVDQANKLIHAYDSSLAKLPGTPYISPLSKFARGTENFPGGGAIVGEEGAELGLFPSGTKIVPHNLTANLVDNLMSVGDMLHTFLSNGAQSFLGGGHLATASAPAVSTTTSKTVIGTINIGSQNDADYLINRIDRNARLDRMGISPINPTAAP